MFQLSVIKPAKRGLALFMACTLAFSATAANKELPKNPLLIGFNEVIDFKNVSKTDVKNATDAVIAETKVSLEKIYQVKPKKRTFQNTMLALDNLYDRFQSGWRRHQHSGQRQPRFGHPEPDAEKFGAAKPVRERIKPR